MFNSTARTAILGSLALLAFSGAHAQTAQTDQPDAAEACANLAERLASGLRHRHHQARCRFRKQPSAVVRPTLDPGA